MMWLIPILFSQANLSFDYYMDEQMNEWISKGGNLVISTLFFTSGWLITRGCLLLLCPVLQMKRALMMSLMLTNVTSKWRPFRPGTTITNSSFSSLGWLIHVVTSSRILKIARCKLILFTINHQDIFETLDISY